MKKILLLFITALFCLTGQKASAQITSAIVAAGHDSLFHFCKLPETFRILGIGGEVTGTVGATDTATINVNYGDGSDTTIKTKITGFSSGGGHFSLSSPVYHTYTMSGVYTVRIIATMTSGGAADTFLMDPLYFSDSCATLKGKLYLDDNSNCVADAGEKGLNWVPIQLVNTTTLDTSWALGWSDTAGDYSANIAPGTYTVTPLVNIFSIGSGDTIKPICPLSGSATLTLAPSVSYTRDFAYDCSPSSTFDIRTYMSVPGYVPGDTVALYVYWGSWWSYYLYSCLGLSTTATLTLDPKLTYVGLQSGLAPSGVSGGVVSWTISGTSATTHFYSSIKVAVSTTATLGDTLECTAYVAPATGLPDPVLSNNTYVSRRVVSSSYDPNMKEAIPGGRGPQGYIAKNTPMTYTIHFQNTGTAAARNITILDTLESDLDASSFHMLGSTHNAEVYREKNVIRFRFNNINLPDSGSNYYGSMGAITYAILPKKDLAPGTEIKNRAAIYFDYNAPIITNYALNTIELPTAIQEVRQGNIAAKVYPNPAHTTLTVSLEDSKSTYAVQILDLLGRRVAAGATESGQLQLHTATLPSGFYLLQITDNHGDALNIKVMIQH